ncbi:transcriptional regulator [Anaerocolumna cellulosilytica]|uniref:Transcriptional regulator n=1 Tax=Anaerocolumna cellulosilytica TaxID=433286 RepID=A0A6S6QSC2_9FIRM|nr:PLP-dependent aminotransferase family protein [Anaerocolumna cellulosilytica]MBB5194570.1 GntR family transcriptional regulator/MocR family aminotransferase [Anaerocolumna cellulosilytica]BCJ93514.1 transcriptional regulator [Anaerocolumna cellulosilytica]
MIYIDKESGRPLYEQIYTQIQRDIILGNIPQGTILPGIRTLSKTLGVARNTVEKAYTQLAVEGYTYSQKGAGFIVECTGKMNVVKQLENLPLVVSDKPSHEKISVNLLYDFQYGNFSDQCFPKVTWRKRMLEVLSSPYSIHMAQYSNRQGNFSLRNELRQYLHQTRGVFCTEDQIIIGSGLHYSLDILSKLLGNKSIAMEEPGYYGAREVFHNNGLRIYPIPSLKEGLDFTQLSELDVSAVYVTPSHQFPYGTVLPISKRQELLEWAVEKNTYIVEDDYDSEYRYDANPVPSLQSIDCNDRVIYLGTFSKSLSPSLRVNYMVLPRHLLPTYHKMFSTYSSPVAWLTQEVLAVFLHSGDYARHVRRMCATFRKRHDTFLQEMSSQFGEKIAIYGKGAGLHFLLEFLDGSNADTCIQKAEEAGIRIYSIKPFWSNQEACPQNILFAGYSLLDEHQIREVLPLLKQIWYP